MEQRTDILNLFTLFITFEAGTKILLGICKGESLHIVRVIADILHLVPSPPTFAHEVNVKINFLQGIELAVVFD